MYPWYPYDAYLYPYAYEPYVYSHPQYSAPVETYEAPPIQREVVYPHGKYVLEGDGVTQPWRWQWIPATPSAPAVPPG